MKIFEFFHEKIKKIEKTDSWTDFWVIKNSQIGGCTVFFILYMFIVYFDYI